MEGTGGGDRAGIDSGDFCSSRHQIKGTMRCAGHWIDAHPVLLVGGRNTGDSAFQSKSVHPRILWMALDPMPKRQSLHYVWNSDDSELKTQELCLINLVQSNVERSVLQHRARMESNSDTVSSQKGKKEMVSEVDPSDYEFVSLCCCHSLDVSCRPRMNFPCPPWQS